MAGRDEGPQGGQWRISTARSGSLAWPNWLQEGLIGVFQAPRVRGLGSQSLLRRKRLQHAVGHRLVLLRDESFSHSCHRTSHIYGRCTAGQRAMAAVSSSSSTASMLVKEARAAGLLPKEKRGTATGYAGVIEIKGKYQARFYDTVRKKQRALPGLHETALDAALALARAEQMLVFEEGEQVALPSPAKRKPRRRAPALAIGMAVPLAAASPRLPFACVQPMCSKPCMPMASPMPVVESHAPLTPHTS